MQAATNVLNSPAGTSSAPGKSAAWDTIEVLEDLLADSIHLRDLYKNARRQTADPPLRRLHHLFDSHYQQQIHLVDVLVDRIRALNGLGGVFAGDFLRRTQFAQLHGDRASITHLLRELIDAHESVLITALPGGAPDDEPANRSCNRDFAVGQVVLTNDQQIFTIRELLMSRDRRLQLHPTWD